MEGTFDDLYANVVVNGGTWVKLVEGSYYFDSVAEGNDLDAAFTQRRYLKILCDNTFSVEYEGDKRRIDYYRKSNTTECFELINYNVE
jgi:hypothetical protein